MAKPGCELVLRWSDEGAGVVKVNVATTTRATCSEKKARGEKILLTKSPLTIV